MTRFVGLDVSQKLTAICVVDETGRRLWRGQCATDPGQIERAVRGHAGEGAKIGVGTRPMTPWLMHELRSRVAWTWDAGAVAPSPVWGSGDADRDRASKLQHAVERMDGDVHLGPLQPYSTGFAGGTLTASARRWSVRERSPSPIPCLTGRWPLRPEPASCSRTLSARLGVRARR